MYVYLSSLNICVLLSNNLESVHYSASLHSLKITTYTNEDIIIIDFRDDKIAPMRIFLCKQIYDVSKLKTSIYGTPKLQKSYHTGKSINKNTQHDYGWNYKKISPSMYKHNI